MTIQLDMFHSEVEILREELGKLRKELSNTRRGLFARHGEMGKEILQLREDISSVKDYVGYKSNQNTIIELLEYVQ